MLREYELHDDKGRWLAQVLLSDNGMVAAVSEYGNFSYAWRSFGGDFRKFLLTIDTSYFAEKMQTGMAYLLTSTKVASACRRFAGNVFPPLQAAIRKEVEAEKPIKPLDVSDWPKSCDVCMKTPEEDCAGCPNWKGEK